MVDFLFTTISNEISSYPRSDRSLGCSYNRLFGNRLRRYLGLIKCLFDALSFVEPFLELSSLDQSSVTNSDNKIGIRIICYDLANVHQYDLDANTGELVYASCVLEEPRYPLDERLLGEWVVTENSTVMSFIGEDEILGYTFNGDNTGCLTVIIDGEETSVDYIWTASYPYITFYIDGYSIPRATYAVEGDVGIILSQGTRAIRRQS